MPRLMARSSAHSRVPKTAVPSWQLPRALLRPEGHTRTGPRRSICLERILDLYCFSLLWGDGFRRASASYYGVTPLSSSPRRADWLSAVRTAFFSTSHRAFLSLKHSGHASKCRQERASSLQANVRGRGCPLGHL